MTRISLFILLFFLRLGLGQAQNNETLSLLFVGDVMGHDTQINAAYYPQSNSYDYESCFKYIAPVFKSVDICIANLEVTLAGAPYKGYPAFSSPDTLADALKNAGVDIIATSNNHACDRGTKGTIRTAKVIDEKGFQRTGTFTSSTDRHWNNPIIIEKNNIKLALLNYAYGSNGLKVKMPTMINYIDTTLIYNDVLNVEDDVDEVLIFFHWGLEYQQLPGKAQKEIVAFCNRLGVRYIVGSHPHVVQPMHWQNKGAEETFTAYSLGNFISNQRTHPRDGGALVQLDFKKDEDGNVVLKDAGYYLTWVYNPIIKERKYFYVLPSADYENKKNFFLTEEYHAKMMENIKSSRKLFKKQNKGVKELKWKKVSK